MFQHFIILVAGSKTSFKPAKSQAVSFCESCGEVCGPNCRSEAILDQAKNKFSSYQTGAMGRF